MKKINYLFILLGLAMLLGFGIWFKSISSMKHSESEDVTVVIERVKAVKKIIVTEGYFSEIYSYKDSKSLYDLIEFTKKALIIVKGKAEVSYDLEKMDFQVDEESKTIKLINMPAPVISIDPELKYYSTQENTFNTFSIDDYNKINKQAIAQLRRKVESSNLKSMARSRLESTLNDLQIVGKELGWKIVVPET